MLGGRRYHLLCLASGAAWAGVAFLLAGPAPGPALWGGILAAPFIGLAAGTLFRPVGRRGMFTRIATSLLSLYLASGLFGVAVGLTDALASRPRGAADAILESVLGVWWGVTLTGYLVVLWPLAFLNHAVLWRLDRRAG